MSSQSPNLKLELTARGKSDIYLACAAWDNTSAAVVQELDRAEMRVVSEPLSLCSVPDRIWRVMSKCNGLVCILPAPEAFVAQHLTFAERLGIPVLVISQDLSGRTHPGLAKGLSVHSPEKFTSDRSIAAGFLHRSIRLPASREYAYFIGRLERDFSHAREAMRAAVECELGLPFLWIDDGKHKTGIDGIRERTPLLLRNASFVIADLTLGVESPQRENPSRAHEIGMSIAFERRLLLLSQEPRRYTYFSINDLQTVFWADEADLFARVKEWAAAHQSEFGRTTWNFRLRDFGHAPRIAPIDFTYCPEQRFVGPNMVGQANQGNSNSPGQNESL